MREIEDIHVPFIAWLHELEIPSVYHRPDRKSGIQPGWPDFTVCWMSRVVFIEAKTPEGRLSQVQENVHAFIRKSGNRVEVCRSVEECQEAVKNILCFPGAPVLASSTASDEGEKTNPANVEGEAREASARRPEHVREPDSRRGGETFLGARTGENPIVAEARLLSNTGSPPPTFPVVPVLASPMLTSNAREGGEARESNAASDSDAVIAGGLEGAADSRGGGENKFANTEAMHQSTSPPEAESAEPPGGPGRDGHKPLMRNRQRNDASPIGSTGGDKHLSGSASINPTDTATTPEIALPAQKFYVGLWDGCFYVFAPDRSGAYRAIRKASTIDRLYLPKLP